MAELKRVWMVRTPTDPGLATDPALLTPEGTLDEESLLFQFCDPEGVSINALVRIIVGGAMHDPNVWAKEKTKLYSDAASAQRDAETRMKKYLQRHKKAYDYSRTD